MAVTDLINVRIRFFFPDSPTTAYFLTAEERVQAIQRIRINQAGVENKYWKREQYIPPSSENWKAFLILSRSGLLKLSRIRKYGLWLLLLL